MILPAVRGWKPRFCHEKRALIIDVSTDSKKQYVVHGNQRGALIYVVIDLWSNMQITKKGGDMITSPSIDVGHDASCGLSQCRQWCGSWIFFMAASTEHFKTFQRACGLDRWHVIGSVLPKPPATRGHMSIHSQDENLDNLG